MSGTGVAKKERNAEGEVCAIGGEVSSPDRGFFGFLMKLLIDTAALIWFLRKDEEISARAAGAMEDSRNQVYVSAAALWEISAKAATGAWVAPDGLGETLSQDLEAVGFRILPIEGRHAEEVYQLPRVHADPLDRVMIAQCRLEKMTAVTNDPAWSDRRYEISTLWK